MEVALSWYFREVVWPKRRYLTVAMLNQVVEHPEATIVQSDGRIRVWGRVEALGNRALRVVLLPDGRTVLNAFLDREAPLPEP